MNHRGSLWIPCVQILLQAQLVLLYQSVRTPQDLRCRSVILIQYDSLGGLMLLIEIHQQLYVRPPPLVDILIRIPHDHQIPIHSRQNLHQPHLHGGAVLKLVHHDIVQPVLPLLPHLRIRLQQVDRKGDKVVKIQRIGGLLFLQEILYDLVVLIL